METDRHARLKWASAAFLRSVGCCAIGLEVRCPLSRFRIDAAGYVDWFGHPLNRGCSYSDLSALLRAGSPSPKSVVIECKQSRADFFRDGRVRDELLEERRRLDELRRTLEEQIVKPSEPGLRRSDGMLFPHMETWDFASSSLPSYRRAQRDLRRVDAQIHGQTKFWALARYALADVLLIAAPAGMFHRREVPPGWGLLEFPIVWLESDAPPDRLPAEQVRLAGAQLHSSPDRRRARLLRNIAAAATRDSTWLRDGAVQGPSKSNSPPPPESPCRLSIAAMRQPAASTTRSSTTASGS